MKYIILFCLLFLAPSIFAGQVTLTEAQVPYSAQSGDTITLDGGANDTILTYNNSSSHVVSDDNGVTAFCNLIEVDHVADVVIYFNGVTVMQEVDADQFSSNQTAIGVDLNCYDSVKIYGPGAIVRNVEGQDGQLAGSDIHNIFLCTSLSPQGDYDSSHYSYEIRDLSLYVDGHDAINIEVRYGGKALIENNDIWCNSNSFTDRQYFNSGAIKCAKRYSYVSDSFGAWWNIINNRIHNSPHFAILTYNAIANIRNNYTLVDAYNELFDTLPCYPGGCGTGHSSANSYSILVIQSPGGNMIANNEIHSGTQRGGSRGIFMEDCSATITSPDSIYRNQLFLNAGPDGENVDGWMRGIRCRTLSAGFWLDYLYVVENYIESVTDNTTLTTAFGEKSAALQFGLGGNDNGFSHLFYERNTVITRMIGVVDVEAYSVGNGASFMPCSFAEATGASNVTIKGNKFLSSGYAVWTADLNNAGSAHDFTFNGDTLGYLPIGDSGDLSTNRAVWRIGNYLVASNDLVSLNTHYVNDGANTDVVLHDETASSSPGEELFQKVRINVYAIGTDGRLKANQNITVTNNYGQELINTSTGTNGYVSEIVTYAYYVNGVGDSLSFSPFTFDMGAVSVDSVVDWTDAGKNIWLSYPGPGDITIPTLTIENYQVSSEGASAQIILTLNTPAPYPIEYSYRTEDSGALGSYWGIISTSYDYEQKYRTGYFDTGETADTIIIQTYDDTLSEGVEYIQVIATNFTTPVNIVDSVGVVTISPSDGRSVVITGLFAHYSVGYSIWNADAGWITQRLLDTLVIINADTLIIEARSYNTNYDVAGNPLQNLDNNSYDTDADYGLVTSQYNRIQIKSGFAGEYATSDVMENLFDLLDDYDASYSTDSAWYDIFETHQLANGDSLIEGGYDWFAFKNAYRAWANANSESVDSTLMFYQRLADSVASHPEINIIAVFGTPLAIGDNVTDSTQAKFFYDCSIALDAWYASLDTAVAYKNFYFINFYRDLCETAIESDRYALRAEWATNGSHLLPVAADVANNIFFPQLVEISKYIYIRQSGGSYTPPEEPIVVRHRLKGFKS